MSRAFSLVRRVSWRTTWTFGLRRRMASPANVGSAMEDLALEVGELHGVEIHDAELADARRGQIHGDRGAEPARSNAQHAGGTNFLLALQPDFGQSQMPRVAADFVAIQFHRQFKTGQTNSNAG